MKIISLLIVISSLLVLAACAEPGKNSAANGAANSARSESVEDIIGKAQAAYQTAKEHEHAWTKTSQLIASAKEKLARGDESAAMVDAQRALFTAKASVAQVSREQAAWKKRVPHL